MDGTAKIRLVVLGLLTLLWGCDNLKEQPQPDSLLNAALPDVYVPLSDSGIGVIDISSAIHLSGAYSIKFSKPRHGRIQINADSTIFSYIGSAEFSGHDTATYTVTKTIAGIIIPPGTGNLIFFTNSSACFVLAVDDWKEYSNTQSFPTTDRIDILANDNICDDLVNLTLTVVPQGSIPGNRFGQVDNKVFYVPASTSWTGKDSTTYTITRNGFTSTAWVKVKRIDCAQKFHPVNDTLPYPASATRLRFLGSDLVANDISCGDIDITSILLVGDSTVNNFHGRVDYDQQDPRYIICIPDSSYSSFGYFVYGVRRRNSTGAANTKFARVYIVKP